MAIVVRWQDDEYEVCIDVVDQSTTVGDLATTLTGSRQCSVAVDGRKVAGTVPVAELDLGDGSIVDLAAAGDPRRFGVLVETPAGVGRHYALVAGQTTIGAAPADVVVEGAVGRVILHTDTSGRFVVRNPEGVEADIVGQPIPPEGTPIPLGVSFRLFARPFVIEAEAPHATPGSRNFNRPPRHLTQHRPAELDPPPPPEQPAKPMRFGWGALIIPVVLGLGMAVLIHPRMAIFALFSPAMLIANWTEDKRRVRRERRESGEAFSEALARFSEGMAKARRLEERHRWEQVTKPEALVDRVSRTDSRLWECRPWHDDFLVLPLGTGCLSWEPALTDRPCPEAARVVARFCDLHGVPITVQPQTGGVVGMAGDRALTLGAVRHLVLQAAVHHGPADLAVSIFSESAGDWDWAKWLPHVLVDGSGRRRIASSASEIESVLAQLPMGDADTQLRHLLIVDLPDLAVGPRALIREALQDGRERGLTAVAIARQPIDLPSLATTVVSLRTEQSHVRLPDGSGVGLSPWTVSAGTARGVARGLARVRDPEARSAGSELPNTIHLASLLGLRGKLDDTIVTNWRRPYSAPATVLGSADDGPFVVDLVCDGPHALLAGTTGAGKSELLRTLIAGLAVSCGPQELNFVLVDYKGGSAFDACAGLPHTVGLVTDLDDHLAKRALSCLEAELRYREQRLRDAGASDLDEYIAAGEEPLPRLLVVVDEFAALAAELPDFMDALVGIAQRGRSLGVHLLLATQRPNGVISDSIKANTNLRIALRVQDVADSVDVIGTADAANLARSLPGRGLARRGPGDVTSFQTALVTGRSLSSSTESLSVSPFVFAHEQPAVSPTSVDRPDEPTDLELIAESCVRVSATLGLPAARSPWPEPLPTSVLLADISAAEQEPDVARFGVADEPHRQRTTTAIWAPRSGNLLLYGLPGSGTTGALATIAVALSAHSSPDRIHLHVLDFDDQDLHPLSGLPHVGSVVAGSDRERQLRLLRRLAAEMQARRSAAADGELRMLEFPTIVTMLDNYGGFADSFSEPGDMAVHNLLARLVADGPGVGMMTILTAKQPGDIPSRIAALVAQRLVFRLADRYDYSGLGVPPVDPPEIPGRAFESGSGREIQVALPHPGGLPAAVAAHTGETPMVGPWTIDVLPREVSITELVAAGRITHDAWFLPLGIGDSSLVPAGLVLRDGENALITGPARSGKTTALVTLAEVARAAHPDMHIAALIPRRSQLSECSALDEVVSVEDIDGDCRVDRNWLLLIDDAELVDPGDPLRALVRRRHSRLRVVAAGSADAIRGLYGHWTQDLRLSRIGCALRPNIVSDGDLWQTQLPRDHQAPFPVGRGYLLADGHSELIQLGCG